MERLTIAGRTEVIVRPGFPEHLLPEREGRGRVAILTQPGPRHIALQVAAMIQTRGLECQIIDLPDGDHAKSLEVAASVYEELGRFGIGRHDTVVGVGGGSVTDLAGFVAGTWLRGVEVVHVATTLLAAVDASVGGKTGVNLGGKNLVGVFWHPSRVLVDTDQLGRLPSALVREGMAEAYKAGLVGDPALAGLIGDLGLNAPLEQVVTSALRVKASLVEQDESERGVRAYLNYGHTIGHAIEYVSGRSHGESVSLGLVAESEISATVTGFPGSPDVRSTLELIGLPVDIEGVDRAGLFDAMAMDKKRDVTGLRMVLLEDVGRPALRHVGASEVDVGLTAIGV